MKLRFAWETGGTCMSPPSCNILQIILFLTWKKICVLWVRKSTDNFNNIYLFIIDLYATFKYYLCVSLGKNPNNFFNVS